MLSTLGTDEEEAAALMGTNGFTIFRKVPSTYQMGIALRNRALYGKAMGEFGAVSVLSGHLQGKTNTMPLYIELCIRDMILPGVCGIGDLSVYGSRDLSARVCWSTRAKRRQGCQRKKVTAPVRAS